MALFTSCEKQGVPHSGDKTGNLYGIWALSKKTTETLETDGSTTTKWADYTNNHFYLALSEFPFPHAIAKKGSFTNFDLDDVDVDAVRFTYNSDDKKISFLKTIWLSDELLTYNMILSGTFEVVELSGSKFVIQQTVANVTTTYTFLRRD